MINSKVKNLIQYHSKLNFYVLFLILFSSIYSSAQPFADKEYYLVDSLELNNLSEQDLELIDTSLALYHNTTIDTVKFEILQFIVDECWNDRVWPRYNSFLLLQLNNKLKTNCTQQDRLKTLNYTAGSLCNVGFLYDQKNDISNALTLYHQSLDLYEFLGDKGGAATLYNNLGVIYSMVSDTAKSFEYHHKSLELKKQIGDVKGVAMSYNNIGTVYENCGMPFIALEYYESSLSVRGNLEDDRGTAMTLCNIGDIYFSQEMYGKTYEFYNKGLITWQNLGNAIGISIALDNMSNVLLKLNRIEEAEKYALESLEIAQKSGYSVDVKSSARTLSTIYKMEGEFEKALEYSDLSIKMNKEVDNTENAKLAMQKSMEYDFHKKELKDSLELVKEREVHHLKIEEKETQAYAMFGGILLLIVILFIAIKSYLTKKKDNHKINEQKHEVESQKLKIEKQHITLAATHKEISDSISYAKRIQDAILPTKEILNHYLKNGFVFFQPKDVVSGDFYWIEKIDNRVIFAVADCTGHGVPGAMVSVVCHNALNRSVREFKITEPASILNKTRELVIETFAGNADNVKDGMDISLCSWNTETNELEWAGANNPLYIIPHKQASINITPPNKLPIGKFEIEQSFTNHVIQLEQGDSLYLFSDGYMDQFGGENGKKYKYSRFRQFLLSIQDKSMEEQNILLEREFMDWKGNLEQLDDVCVIGVRIS